MHEHPFLIEQCNNSTYSYDFIIKRCLKKYCVCYNHGLKCNRDKCRCNNCANIEGGDSSASFNAPFTPKFATFAHPHPVIHHNELVFSNPIPHQRETIPELATEAAAAAYDNYLSPKYPEYDQEEEEDEEEEEDVAIEEEDVAIKQEDCEELMDHAANIRMEVLKHLHDDEMAEV